MICGESSGGNQASGIGNSCSYKKKEAFRASSDVHENFRATPLRSYYIKLNMAAHPDHRREFKEEAGHEKYFEEVDACRNISTGISERRSESTEH